MSKNTSNKKQYDSFLNVKKSIQLPSNLLSLKKHSLQLQSSVNQPKAVPQSMNQTKYLKNMQQVPPSFVQEKGDEKKNKSVLYKRLTSIKKQNKELGNLSFSKMLSRMVVMQEDEEQPNYYTIQQRIKHPSIVKPIEQKMYHMKELSSARRPISRSIEVQDFDKPSRKLFKRYYMPNSEAMQTNYLQTINPDDKYIYKNGKKVECKRIHNFYTSNMFRKGYDKFLRKTTQGFHRP